MQPQTNPYIEALTEEQRKQSNLNTRRHKFSVHALYMWEKPIREEFYDKARTYCKQNHIEFVLREFYTGMPEDREYVERLPAFHIYYEEEWVMTFYNGNELESHLQQIIEEVKIEKRKVPWNLSLTQWFSQSIDTLKLPGLRTRRIASSLPN